jgi:hypothetical protein
MILIGTPSHGGCVKILSNYPTLGGAEANTKADIRELVSTSS